MKIIKEISEYIREEMDGVCDYIKFASKIKNENMHVFEVLMEIIPQEIKHVEIWHSLAVSEISKMKEMLRSQGKEVPPYMIEMWQDEHEEYIEDMGRIKYKLEMLRK